MSNELQVIPGGPAWRTEENISLIKRTVAAGATKDELDLFFYQCERAGLDPLAKQIYFVKRKGKGVIQVGIDGLRLIADRTGKYAGSDDAEFDGTTDRGYPVRAKVVVYRMVGGQRCAFAASARWDEYYPGDDQGFQWRKMPCTMLAKCAEALALRKAFPADMSGLYIHEEMEQADASAAPQPIPAGVSQAERERNAKKFLSESCGITPSKPEWKEFADACDKDLTWPDVALQAEQSGVTNLEQLMRFVRNGEAPSTRPARDPQAILEGRAFAETVQSEFTESRPETGPRYDVPEGKSAFGYVPDRWPLGKMFNDPMTDSQKKMMVSKARERMLPEEDLPTIRRLVIEAYGLEDDASKANASLFIDWLLNANEDTLDEAVKAAESADPSEPFDLTPSDYRDGESAGS